MKFCQKKRENYAVEKQYVIPNWNADYTTFYGGEDKPRFDQHLSRLFCGIELDDSEANEIKEHIRDTRYLSLLTQKVLEEFFYKYNIDNLDEKFQIPTYCLVAPIFVFLDTNHSRNRRNQQSNEYYQCFPFIRGHDLEFRLSPMAKFEDKSLYFLAKAVDEYKKNLHFDSIISSAISLESYLYYVVRLNELDDSYLFYKDGSFRRALSTAYKLYDKKFIGNKLSKEELKSLSQPAQN